MKLRTLLILTAITQPAAVLPQAPEPPAEYQYNRFAPPEVDWLVVHYTTPNPIYVGQGLPQELVPSKHGILNLDPIPNYTADVVPGLELDPVLVALRDGKDLPGGVVRLGKQAASKRHCVRVEGSRIEVTSNDSNAVVAEREYMPLIRMYPKEGPETWGLSVVFDEKSGSFVVFIEDRPQPREPAHATTLFALVIRDEDAAGRWAAFAVSVGGAIDFRRWLLDPNRYGLFWYRGRVYWVVPEANQPHLDEAKRILVVTSIPATKKGLVEVQISGHLDKEVRR